MWRGNIDVPAKAHSRWVGIEVENATHWCLCKTAVQNFLAKLGCCLSPLEQESLGEFAVVNRNCEPKMKVEETDTQENSFWLDWICFIFSKQFFAVRAKDPLDFDTIWKDTGTRRP